MPSVAIIGTRGYPSYYGGFETAVRKLAPYLVDQGWDVTVYSRPGATNKSDPTRDERVHVVTTKGFERKSISTLSYGLTAALHAARAKPDVALVMNVANGYWLPILKRAGIPTLVNVDGIEWDREKWGRVAKWVFRTGATWTARHGDRLVFDSEEIARRWAVDFSRDGVFIPYGGEVPEEALPVEPGLVHRSYALMVARFVPENTVPEFLDAADAISETHDVVIVGSTGYGGDLDDQVQKLASRKPRVHWLGHVSDDRRLNSLWQHSGAYFHGHSVGGTNPALVQAMACAAPIVARDTIYNREVLGAGGTYAQPVAADIAGSLLGMLASQTSQTEAAQNALARRVGTYTWDSVNAKYDESLGELLARR
ncbi:glycosyltransferase [Microbacterium sp. R86528]|uniref:glycosyltransferase n=1 Tax=Microbacterium sp. R86528 TaxID=3093864 RepID=UPI0037C96BC4